MFNEQTINQRVRRDNTTGYKGVYWNTGKHIWESYIAIAGKWSYLGGFKQKNAAVKARQKAEMKIAGLS